MSQRDRFCGPLACVMTVVGSAAPVSGQPVDSAGPMDEPAAEAARPGEREGEASASEPIGRHPIGGLEVVFLRAHSDHPPLSEVLEGSVRLERRGEVWDTPSDGEAGQLFTLSSLGGSGPDALTDRALAAVIEAVSRRLTELDLLGVYAEADASQFGVTEGRIEDLRPADEGRVRVLVTTGVVGEVRTSALGERFRELADDTGEDPRSRVNLEEHRRIRERSPIDPPEEQEEGERPLLKRGAISDYALFLSRHPGRRVDISVAPSALEPGTVTLDYLVTENKPWIAYAQISNTGTEATNEWQERFGFVQNQLTNADDVFSIEYVTNSFEGTNALFSSYERPIGLDGRLRGRVFGSWYEYDASSVGQPGVDFEGDGFSVGAEAIGNIVQLGDSFIDAVAGVRFDRIKVENALAIDPNAEEDVVVGYAGLRFDRSQGTNLTFADLTLEWSFDGLSGTSVNSLGRAEADEDWAVLRAGFSQSVFLETLIDPRLADSGSLAHELAVSARGQWSFGNRLAPNYQQVAGGFFTVRGYEQSIVAGDNAVLASAEYRFHLPRSFSPSAAPADFFGTPFRFAPQYRTGPVDWDFQVKGFLDVAHVDNEDRFTFERDETLVGAGFGFELAIRRNLRARADFGWALAEVVDQNGQVIVDQGDNEIHLLLTLAY